MNYDLRCSWCDERRRDRSDLKAHEDEHRLEDAENAKVAAPIPDQHHTEIAT